MIFGRKPKITAAFLPARRAKSMDGFRKSGHPDQSQKLLNGSFFCAWSPGIIMGLTCSVAPCQSVGVPRAITDIVSCVADRNWPQQILFLALRRNHSCSLSSVTIVYELIPWANYIYLYLIDNANITDTGIDFALLLLIHLFSPRRVIDNKDGGCELN